MENDKENIHSNNLSISDSQTRFNQVLKPKLSVQRKYLQKIEKEIGIRKWTRAEPVPPGERSVQHNFRDTENDGFGNDVVEYRQEVLRPEPLSSAKKTMDLFTKAREALNNPDSVKYTNDMLNQDSTSQQRAREILPKPKRTGLWKKAEVEAANEASLSPKSPKPKVEIPFSKNRYINEGNNSELIQENKKKAIQFLKKEKEEKKKKDIERLKLIEKKRRYTEQVRRQNKEKLKKSKRRNNSTEGGDSDMKAVKHTTSIRSKSEEIKGKSFSMARRYARNRTKQTHHSEAKAEDSVRERKNYIQTLSVEDEVRNHTIEQHSLERPNDVRRELPVRASYKVAINVDLAANMNKNHKEIISFHHIENSEQKNSIDEDDGKYVKTPELNMGEKYSHK